MPMTQTDIRDHYETFWKSIDDQATGTDSLRQSSQVEDLLIAPIYKQLVGDLGIAADGGSILDVGCGSGRWLRYFLDWFRPKCLMGIDGTRSSPGLLERWSPNNTECELSFRTVDITAPYVDLGQRFDLINVGNVLFHVPEHDLFMQALRNLARQLGPRGHIITTEYLPRATMRTEWMLVRSRYEFEAAVAEAGLRIIDVRAFGFFANDPMGLDGPDNGTRGLFYQVKTSMNQITSANLNDQDRGFMVNLLAAIEQATLSFCSERVPDIDLPSQKLVALATNR